MKTENFTWTNAGIVVVAGTLVLLGIAAVPAALRCPACTVADLLDGFGSLVAAIAGLLVLVGLKSAAQQVAIASAAQRAETYDRRVAATFTFFNFADFYTREAAATVVLDGLHPRAQLNFSDVALTPAQVQQIVAVPQSVRTLRLHMGDLEDYSIAYTAEAIDPWCAYHSMSSYLQGHFKVLQPLVMAMRASTKDPNLFLVWEQTQIQMNLGPPPLRPPART